MEDEKKTIWAEVTGTNKAKKLIQRGKSRQEAFFGKLGLFSLKKPLVDRGQNFTTEQIW